MAYGDRTYFYPNILKKVTTAFLSLFADVRIAKYDEAGNIINYRNVPITFGQKQKFLASIKKSSQLDFSQSLPRMSVIITGLNYTPAKSQGSEINQIFKNTVSPTVFDNIFRPTPYTLDFTLSIVSLHITEMNQILEQILPFFNPSKTLTIQEFDAVPSFTRDIKVLLTNTVPDFQDEIAEEDIRKILWDLNFSVDVFLYKPVLQQDLIKHVKVELLNSAITVPTSADTNLMETYTYSVSGTGLDNFIVTEDAWTQAVSG